MVEGIQFKKLSLERQVDSIFGDEDLIRLGESELTAMCQEYFGSDWRKAIDHLIQRRRPLLNAEDVRKYQREYQHRRKEREVRVFLRLNRVGDKDILDWLDKFENKSEAIKDAIRMMI